MADRQARYNKPRSERNDRFDSLTRDRNDRRGERRENVTPMNVLSGREFPIKEKEPTRTPNTSMKERDLVRERDSKEIYRETAREPRKKKVERTLLSREC